MDILEYTSFDEIRQAVGLSSDELSDSMLSAEMYANTLQLKLQEVTLPSVAPGPGPLDTRFLAIVAILESARTPLEQRLYNLTRLFSTYVVAAEVATSLSTRAPKSSSDGKRTLVRFSPESVYETTANNIKKQLDDLRQQIENIVSPEIVVFPLLSAVKPFVNVVTNE